MPTKLPDRNRAEASRVQVIKQDDSYAWLVLWALSVGFSAIFLAAIIYVNHGDLSGAATILLIAAVLIGAVLFSGRHGHKSK